MTAWHGEGGATGPTTFSGILGPAPAGGAARLLSIWTVASSAPGPRGVVCASSHRVTPSIIAAPSGSCSRSCTSFGQLHSVLSLLATPPTKSLVPEGNVISSASPCIPRTGNVNIDRLAAIRSIASSSPAIVRAGTSLWSTKGSLFAAATTSGDRENFSIGSAVAPAPGNSADARCAPNPRATSYEMGTSADPPFWPRSRHAWYEPRLRHLAARSRLPS